MQACLYTSYPRFELMDSRKRTGIYVDFGFDDDCKTSMKDVLSCRLAKIYIQADLYMIQVTLIIFKKFWVDTMCIAYRYKSL